MDATDPTEEDRLLNACPSCGHVIDVSHFEPYSKILCEKCSDTIRVRTSFHHFQIKEQIGIGGMSRVFRAVDTALNREVALKILNRQCSTDERRVVQFEREARITAAMSHPNVVKVFSSGKDQGYFYIAMELVTGGSLDDKIRKENRVTEPKMLEIAIETARGLKAALQAGLIHRDVKPGNILFTEDGTAKIVDFGLALMYEKDVDTDPEIWATPYYVPPEKLNGGVEDHRSDIYSLGASLFHAVLGHPPYGSDTNSLEELKVLKNQTVNLSEADLTLVSSETAGILECCLKKDPAERYNSYDDLITHLEFAKQSLGKARPGSGRGQNAGLSGPVKIGAAAAIAALLGVGIWMATRPEEAGDSSVLQIDTDPTAATDKTISSQFSAARDALFNGQLPEAGAAFEALGKSAPQPTASWAIFNDGLCSLLQGRESEASSIFSTLAPVGEGELAGFFAEASRILGADGPVPAENAAAFSPGSFKAMGLLAAGLKNWQRGDWRGAAALLQSFNDAKPGNSHSWVNNYKPLVQPHLADLKLLAELPSFQLENVAVDAAKAALEKAVNISASLSLPGAVKEAVSGEVAAFGKAVELHVDAMQKAAASREVELQKEESQKLAVAVSEAAVAAAGMRFSDAVKRLQKEQFQSSAMQERARDEVHTWQQAEEFLVQLANDLAAAGFEGEIERIGAPPQRGKITTATRDGVTLRVAGAAGETVIPYSQIPPLALIKMAEAPLSADKITDSDEYFRRRELVVAFALKSGQTIYAGMRGNELAKELRSFQARWKRLQPNVEF